MSTHGKRIGVLLNGSDYVRNLEPAVISGNDSALSCIVISGLVLIAVFVIAALAGTLAH